ncbi:MAG TPA: hypothetical protein VMY34_00580, partial [Acidimicrobiales bacterium]|nr:hypothetical protein [Acidimicrobiales bacterium]
MKMHKILAIAAGVALAMSASRPATATTTRSETKTFFLPGAGSNLEVYPCRDDHVSINFVCFT